MSAYGIPGTFVDSLSYGEKIRTPVAIRNLLESDRGSDLN